MTCTDPTVAVAIDLWLREHSHLRPVTRKDLRQASARWSALWGDRCLSSIDEDAVREWLLRYRETHAASSTNHERSLLSWFFGWSVKRRLRTDNPVRLVEPFPHAGKAARVLSSSEVDRVLAAADERARALILLAVETGLREHTISLLRWEWIDSEGWVTIPGEAMKGRETYRAPLSPVALEALRSIRDRTTGSVFQRAQDTLQEWARRAMRRAGVQATFHDLRRTFFTRARQRGVPLEVAMALSDHRDYRTALRHYRAISPDELLRAVGRAPDGRAPPEALTP